MTRAAGTVGDRAARQLPKPLRIVKSHKRLFRSLAVGIVAFAIQPLCWQVNLATRYLVAWDVFVILFLVQAIVLIARFDVGLRAGAQRTRRWRPRAPL